MSSTGPLYSPPGTATFPGFVSWLRLLTESVWAQLQDRSPLGHRHNRIAIAAKRNDSRVLPNTGAEVDILVRTTGVGAGRTAEVSVMWPGFSTSGLTANTVVDIILKRDESQIAAVSVDMVVPSTDRSGGGGFTFQDTTPTANPTYTVTAMRRQGNGQGTVAMNCSASAPASLGVHESGDVT